MTGNSRNTTNLLPSMWAHMEKIMMARYVRPRKWQSEYIVRKTLPCIDVSMPHVIVGDKAFPLCKHLMRPYPGNQTKNNEAKKIFNDRLSRTRRTSENVFGVWTQRYRVFQRRIITSAEHFNKVVLATCSLHK
jgi:hypothetical protein